MLFRVSLYLQRYWCQALAKLSQTFNLQWKRDDIKQQYQKYSKFVYTVLLLIAVFLCYDYVPRLFADEARLFLNKPPPLLRQSAVVQSLAKRPASKRCTTLQSDEDDASAGQMLDLLPLPQWISPATTSNTTLHICRSTAVEVTTSFSLLLAGHTTSLHHSLEQLRAYLHQHTAGAKAASSDYQPQACVQQIHLQVDDLSSELQHTTDESYELHINDCDTSSQSFSVLGMLSPAALSRACSIRLSSPNMYGMRHALQTLYQLFDYNPLLQQSILQANATLPLHIIDHPAYIHRGLLIDTARHYLPVQTLQLLIDGLAMVKMNVLHWHLTDSESFPLQCMHTSCRRLTDGAFSPSQVYTQQHVRELVAFAKLRGVRVILEIDSPGHTSSWCKGYPHLCPTTTNKQCEALGGVPIDVTQAETWQVIEQLYNEVIGYPSDDTAALTSQPLQEDQLFHIGGDEVNVKCWALSPNIVEYTQFWNLTLNDLFSQSIMRTTQYSRQRQKTPIVWEESFKHMQTNLDRNTIVQMWIDKHNIYRAAAAGYKVLSSMYVWYLDKLDVPWLDVYTHSPTAGFEQTEAADNVLGGEVCMWGETVDSGNLFVTVFPKAAAAAERLWSNPQLGALPLQERIAHLQRVAHRLKSQRCRMQSAGISSGSVEHSNVKWKVRNPPTGASSCFS